MITILGAGGVISNELVGLLIDSNQRLRLVSRRGTHSVDGAQSIAADLTDRDQTVDAVAGSRVVFLLAGLKYDHKLWAEAWPRIMANTIEACKRARARLVFFDNVYMYGKVSGPMTEETPFNPCTRKGEVRAKIAMDLIDEWKAGRLTGMIIRSADFYGPGASTGIPNTLVFDPMSKGRKAMCLASDSLQHSYTYTPDAARAIATLADSASAWNQTWHAPTRRNPPTSKEFITMAANAMNRPPKYRILSRPMIRIAGFFDPVIGEVYEMLYQNDSPYIFDSTKYANAFGFAGTPYAEGISATAHSYV